MTRWPADAAFIEGEHITVPGGEEAFFHPKCHFLNLP